MSNYKVCSFCGQPILQKGKYKYCSEECFKKSRRENNNRNARILRLKRKTDKECICATCGKHFMASHKRKYCCKECRDSHWTNRERANRSFVEGYWVKAKRRVPCLNCGKLTDRNDAKFFCSKKCADEYRLLENKYKLFEHYMLNRHLFRLVSALRLTVRKKKENKRHTESLNKTLSRICKCKQCGKIFNFHIGSRPIFCSKECAKTWHRKHKTEQEIEYHKSTTNNRRRAKKYGCEYDPTVRITKVFDRDGWVCQICGIKTPKEKRGSFDDDAPELDHIVPMSKGGGHTWKNVQCACRKCNISKGSNLFPGRRINTKN